MDRLVWHSRSLRVPAANHAITPYQNSIAPDQETAYPGDEEMEQRIENLVRIAGSLDRRINGSPDRESGPDRRIAGPPDRRRTVQYPFNTQCRQMERSGWTVPRLFPRDVVAAFKAY